MIVSLVGLRGVGKTTVAGTLAEMLQAPWVDLDGVIESRAGRSVAEILTHEGEPAFREWETAALAVVLQSSGAIVATGGGVVLREANRRLLAEAGPVVWLQAGVETLRSRLAADAGQLAARPALTSAGTLAELERLAVERARLYRGCATLEVATDGRDPRDIALEIIRRVPLVPGQLR